jgi:hypothetical protein
VALADAAGAIWLLTPAAAAPRRLVHLGTSLVPPLVLAGPLLGRWPATGGEDDEFSLAEDRGMFVLVNTADGFLVQVRYPFAPATP